MRKAFACLPDETSLHVDARRYEPDAPIARIVVERISDARARRLQVARLFLEQRKLEVWRGSPRLERMGVVGRRQSCAGVAPLRRALALVEPRLRQQREPL